MLAARVPDGVARTVRPVYLGRPAEGAFGKADAAFASQNAAFVPLPAFERGEQGAHERNGFVARDVARLGHGRRAASTCRAGVQVCKHRQLYGTGLAGPAQACAAQALLNLPIPPVFLPRK